MTHAYESTVIVSADRPARGRVGWTSPLQRRRSGAKLRSTGSSVGLFAIEGYKGLAPVECLYDFHWLFGKRAFSFRSRPARALRLFIVQQGPLSKSPRYRRLYYFL